MVTVHFEYECNVRVAENGGNMQFELILRNANDINFYIQRM